MGVRNRAPPRQLLLGHGNTTALKRKRLYGPRRRARALLAMISGAEVYRRVGDPAGRRAEVGTAPLLAGNASPAAATGTGTRQPRRPAARCAGATLCAPPAGPLPVGPWFVAPAPGLSLRTTASSLRLEAHRGATRRGRPATRLQKHARVMYFCGLVLYTYRNLNAYRRGAERAGSRLAPGAFHL